LVYTQLRFSFGCFRFLVGFPFMFFFSFFSLILPHPPLSTLFPYTTLFRSDDGLYILIAIAFPSLCLIFSFQRSPVLYCLLKVRQWLFYDWDGIHRSGPSV